MQPERDQQQWKTPEASSNNAPYQPVASDDEVLDAPQENYNDRQTNDSAFNEVTENTQPREEFDQDVPLLSWDAQEYSHQEQTALWYIVLAIVSIMLMLLAIFLLKSWTFAILVPIMAISLAVYTRRPPGAVHYTLSRKGIHVNDVLHTFDEFRSFGVVSTAQSHSIVLVPRKRLSVGLTVYFPENLGEQIVDMFAARLPMKDIQPDFVDRLLAKIRL